MRESSQELSAEIWQEWILEAIRKIRSQKQRPSIQRICQAIGSHHKFHEDIVAGKLEEAVKSGAVIKLYNKGLHSYKAPVARKSITVTKDTDLSRLVVKAVRELGECDGSNIKSIESYVQKSNNIVLSNDCDFKTIIKNSLKRAVSKEFLIQDGKLYKVGKVSLTSPRKQRVTKTQTNKKNKSDSNHSTDKLNASSISGASNSSYSTGCAIGNSSNMSANRSADQSMLGTSINVSTNYNFYLKLFSFLLLFRFQKFYFIFIGIT